MHQALQPHAPRPSPPRQARTKEERIEAMHARAARRFDPKGQCWEAWKENWAEERRMRRMLARCAGRLARPRLVACLSTWISDWEISQTRTAAQQQLANLGKSGRAMLEAAVASEREQCQRLLKNARRELEQVQERADSALAAAAQQRAALLERQRLELHGSAEEILAAREARIKQERADATLSVQPHASSRQPSVSNCPHHTSQPTTLCAYPLRIPTGAYRIDVRSLRSADDVARRAAWLGGVEGAVGGQKADDSAAGARRRAAGAPAPRGVPQRVDI